MAEPLDRLRRNAKRCQDCPLWANATKTVFGAGNPHARAMLVGEQPGDEEDRKGLPFVGPAGRLLDACRQWLEREIATVKPRVSEHAEYVFATLHPSALLRLRNEDERENAFQQFVRDLALIKEAVGR